MRRAIAYLLIFFFLLALPFGVRYLRFYGLRAADREPAPSYELEEVPARVPTPPASEFQDQPQVGEGLVLLDLAHDNQFDLNDISFLDSRLAARGYELINFRGGDMASALRPVSAFIVIAPLSGFDLAEVQAVVDYVGRGGRLLLVGDPTRFAIDLEEDLFTLDVSIDTDRIPLNSLANAFDLVFNGDYLYNTVENEGNFRNIILKQSGLAEDELTNQVSQLAFYGSHSVQVGSGGRALLNADDNTWSSATDRPGNLTLAALSANDRVLAFGDVDFLSEPYFTVYDNSLFIAHVADFLTNSERGVVLTDYPFFYQSDIDLVYAGDPDLGPDAFDEIIALQEAFRRVDKTLKLADEPDDDHDALYLGLYNQADEVDSLLELAQISLVIDPPIVAEDEELDDQDGDGESEEDRQDGTEEPNIRRIESPLGKVQMSGTALILLDEDEGQRRVIVLAASNEGLESTIDRLLELVSMNADKTLSDCLLQDQIALCPTNVADEEVQAVLETGGSPEAPEAEPGDEGEIPTEGEELPRLGAELQGSIALDETIEGTLAEEQSHAWIFSGGPAVVDIILQPDDEMDGVLELYDPEGKLISTADSAFTGEEERLVAIDIADDQEYTIVVRDYFDDGGGYALSVTESTPDEFETVDQGELPFDELVSGVLGEDETHSWTFTVDSPISVTITLQSGPEMDGVLVLLDANDLPLAFADNTGEGGEEVLESIDLTEAGEYTVIVDDLFGIGGEYTLLLEQAP